MDKDIDYVNIFLELDRPILLPEPFIQYVMAKESGSKVNVYEPFTKKNIPGVRDPESGETGYLLKSSFNGEITFVPLGLLLKICILKHATRVHTYSAYKNLTIRYINGDRNIGRLSNTELLNEFEASEYEGSNIHASSSMSMHNWNHEVNLEYDTILDKEDPILSQYKYRSAASIDHIQLQHIESEEIIDPLLMDHLESFFKLGDNLYSYARIAWIIKRAEIMIAYPEMEVPGPLEGYMTYPIDDEGKIEWMHIMPPYDAGYELKKGMRQIVEMTNDIAEPINTEVYVSNYM